MLFDPGGALIARIDAYDDKESWVADRRDAG
jgi:hypothetical protein